MKALYRKGDLLAPVKAPEQACMVTEDQYSLHVKVRRAGQPVDEFIREEDLMVYGGQDATRTDTHA